MLIVCPECKNQVSDTAKVCIHCGFDLSCAIKCPGCGKTVKKDDKCSECGYDFNGAEKKEDVWTRVVVNNRGVFQKNGETDKYYCKKCKKPFCLDNTVCPYCNEDAVEENDAYKFSEVHFEPPKKDEYVPHEQPKKNEGTAIASMILGICGLFFTFVSPGPGLACGIVGAILGHKYDSGYGKAGKIMSWISIATCIISLVLVVCILGGTAFGLSALYQALSDI